MTQFAWISKRVDSRPRLIAMGRVALLHATKQKWYIVVMSLRGMGLSGTAGNYGVS